MDWNGVPDSAQNRLSVSVWHDIVESDTSNASGNLPTNDSGTKPGDIVTIWLNSDPSKPQIVNFTQRNLVSAIGALITTLPARQRLSAADLVLPASSFSESYVLCQTLAALYTHASLAITSVASPGVDLSIATRSIAPTVVIASAETLTSLHEKEAAAIRGIFGRYGKSTQSSTLSTGRMPTGKGLLFRFLAPSASALGNKPGRLRLILTSDRIGCDTPPLTSSMLSDLRIFTRARICYALTAAQVCGAVAQTNVFDYRTNSEQGERERVPGQSEGQAWGQGRSHFGTPLSCVEVKLANKRDPDVAGNEPEGEIVVSGPAVSGGESVGLGVKGRFREDGTLQLL